MSDRPLSPRMKAESDRSEHCQALGALVNVASFSLLSYAAALGCAFEPEEQLNNIRATLAGLQENLDKLPDIPPAPPDPEDATTS